MSFSTLSEKLVGNLAQPARVSAECDASICFVNGTECTPEVHDDVNIAGGIVRGLAAGYQPAQGMVAVRRRTEMQVMDPEADRRSLFISGMEVSIELQMGRRLASPCPTCRR
jgi:hypothetical protein